MFLRCGRIVSVCERPTSGAIMDDNVRGGLQTVVCAEACSDVVSKIRDFFLFETRPV